MNLRTLIRTGLVAGLIGASSLATVRAAVAVGPRDNVQVAGFFSQGYLHTSGNNYPIAAGDGTFMFREMGFSASTVLGANVRLGAQAFAQRFGPFGGDEVKLDWAVVDWNLRQEFGIRAGRVKYPKGLYGEALDIDSIRPFIFLPQNIYSPVLRDFSASFDGAMLYGALSLGNAGALDYKAFYGDIPMDPEQGVAEFFTSTGLFKQPQGISELGMDYVTGLSLDWGTPVSGLKIHASYSYFENVNGDGLFAYVPFPAPMNVSVDRYAYTTFGAEWATGDWTFAAEWQRQGGNAVVLTQILPPDRAKTGSDSYYLAATRRLNDRWEVGSYIARGENLHPDAGTPSWRKAHTDYALSLRHNLNDNALVKLEWHYIDGSFGVMNTPRVPNPSSLRADHTQVLAAKTTLSF